MNYNLDNELQNRIRDVFDNYEDATADAGWGLLRQKFPEKEKRRVIAWWWYPAAAVLLMCFGLWFFYPQTAKQVVYNQKTSAQNGAVSKMKQNGLPNKITKPGGNLMANKQQAVMAVDTANTLRAINPGIKKGSIAFNRDNAFKPSNRNSTGSNRRHEVPSTLPVTPQLLAVAKPDNNKLPALSQPNPTESGDLEKTAGSSLANTTKNNRPAMSAAGLTQNKADSAADGPQQVASANLAEAQPGTTSQVSAGLKKTDAVLKMIAADNVKQASAHKEVKKERPMADKRAVLLSVYAATFFNYSKGSNSQINAGGGFTSDFRLSDNFKLSTGLSLAQNKLSYQNANTIPQQLSERVIAYANAKRNYDPAGSAYYSVSTGFAGTSTSVKSYDASFVGLDIPLNLKYQFNPQKSDSFISAGVSSGTFINETYKSAYFYSAAGAGVSSIGDARQASQTTDRLHFSRFDLAKTLNFSFGVGYPLGKFNRLIIEPFVKYPLGGLGSQDIRFGSGGVNLKINFKGAKK